MRGFTAFMKKEYLEMVRTGRLIIIGVLFVIFGIMAPAFAKMTPWMMEMMADSLADSGIAFTGVEVNALTSWAQFYKNIGPAIIIFAVMNGNNFAGEFEKNTLVPMVTKGLAKYKIALSKVAVMAAVWSIAYWACYGIAYGYTQIYWDNGIAKSVGGAGVLVWVFGLWIVSLLGLAGAVTKTVGTALVFTGAGFGVSFVLGMFARYSRYMPTQLLKGYDILKGSLPLQDCMVGLAVTIFLIAVNVTAAAVIFNRRKV